MIDSNGKIVAIGATAVVLAACMNKGCVGTVHAISGDRVRVGAGDPAGHGLHFSSWCKGKDIAIVEPSIDSAPTGRGER